MGKRNYDFAGWVTKNDIKCSDGVTIKHDTFRDSDGQKVPLVWNHDYNSPTNVLGHVTLEHRDAGVYGYGYFNDTQEAGNAKTLVSHGDISSMSIGARKIKRNGADVVHGQIYEVSLVLSAANPGALIDTVMNHSEDGDEEKGILYTGTLIHAYDDIIDEGGEAEMSNDNRTVEDVIDTMNDEQKEAVYALVGTVADQAAEESSITHNDDEDKTIEEVIDTMNDDQKEAVYALVGMITDEELADEDYDEDDEDEIKQSHKGKGDGETMKHNVFNAQGTDGNEETIKHSANEVLKQAQSNKVSSLRDTLEASEVKGGNGEVLTHGINSIEMLFPEAAHATNGNTPILYKDSNTAYEEILNAISKSPFSRVKTLVADLTEDEARAKGYIKGNMKKEEFFSLIKRNTAPTTIYKKQKLDRDDVIDITDFDVVSFMNVEMQMMLKEEIARAVLVGDGRDFSDDDKVDEQNIRPVISDHEFFTIHKAFSNAAAFIETVITAMAEYRGSGRPNLYIDPTLLSQVKLLKDNDGRFLFGDIPSDEAIANRLGLGKVVATTFMAGKGALIVNLRDYTLGSTKGGKVTNFDDFDIDFNQYKYLIETRLSGALTMPKSAIHLQEGADKGTAADDEAGGVTYGNRSGSTTTTTTTQG